MVVNARKQEHLASCCEGPQTLLRPWRWSSSPPRRGARVPGALGTHWDDPQGPLQPRGWLGPGQAWPCGLPKRWQTSVCLTPREGP